MYTLIVRNMDSFGMYEDVFEYKTFEDLFAAYEGHSDSRLNPLMRLEDADSMEPFVWCEGKYEKQDEDEEYFEDDSPEYVLKYMDKDSWDFETVSSRIYSDVVAAAKKHAAPETMIVLTVVYNNDVFEREFNSLEEM